MHVRSARAHARTFPVRRVILWLSIAVVSIVAIVSIAITNRIVPPIAETAPPYHPLSVGDPAPLFSAATTQGAFSLDATHRPVFLEIFATWCPHCQRETVALNKLYGKYAKRVDFVAVTGSPPSASPDHPAFSFVQYFGCSTQSPSMDRSTSLVSIYKAVIPQSQSSDRINALHILGAERLPS